MEILSLFGDAYLLIEHENQNSTRTMDDLMENSIFFSRVEVIQEKR